MIDRAEGAELHAERERLYRALRDRHIPVPTRKSVVRRLEAIRVRLTEIRRAELDEWNADQNRLGEEQNDE
jgi:hypothetical protein